MIERVQSLTGIGQTPRWSGTFHSIGGRLLRQYGHHIGLSRNYTIMDQSDSESLLTSIIKDSDKLFLKNKDNPKTKVIHSILSYARNTRQSFDDLFRSRYPWQEKIFTEVSSFVKLYDVAKRERQVVDYDDLLVLCRWRRLLGRGRRQWSRPLRVHQHP